MTNLKVVKVHGEYIEFNDGTKLYSNHDQDCCESHYLNLADLAIEDFDGLEFDLSGDDFFERIPDYGISLKPINGHPVRIAGYASNNGYYSANLDLVVQNGKIKKVYDITECQKDV